MVARKEDHFTMVTVQEGSSTHRRFRGWISLQRIEKHCIKVAVSDAIFRFEVIRIVMRNTIGSVGFFTNTSDFVLNKLLTFLVAGSCHFPFIAASCTDSYY